MTDLRRTPPTDRLDLLRQIEAARAELEAVLRRVPEDAMTTAALDGGWSVKDLLVHISAWERWMLSWFALTARGEPVTGPAPGYGWDEVDRLNRDTYLANRDRPLADVRSDFERAYAEVLAGVGALSDAELADPHHYGEDAPPPWQIIGENTTWHYRDHAEALAAWLDAQQH